MGTGSKDNKASKLALLSLPVVRYINRGCCCCHSDHYLFITL